MVIPTFVVADDPFLNAFVCGVKGNVYPPVLTAVCGLRRQLKCIIECACITVGRLGKKPGCVRINPGVGCGKALLAGKGALDQNQKIVGGKRLQLEKGGT